MALKYCRKNAPYFLPQSLSCVSRVKEVFTLLLSLTPCTGNSDERFLLLSANRDGGFWNAV